ncbi:mycofactocin system GMC family oxidoreductase MftG [Nocardia implantans]|uniref:Mycofactocin system GMC family oxidoreductase MftG n=1 Tax=Nocardia implantans TaxID=3108168 RepID=A0ABU6AXP1_9NOCA|nr:MULTISPECIES: mycofactocin system GMC family oxidoreductase MftG [unclassified Nocardia]MBF6190671.1 mycofactocin system GMC family oxidoreductase MftG [Nocardia beijingensis]MEA3528583.1 mycofactocin system GMC family oxidoreductase MftG [Nocardia sp. CDC192]MEB3512265.1 mycofactocin system GMC family oxidoreductase MftG [Nocardia sp. CDC186]
MADTLIVGGGTAGCVLAERLSADPAHTVRLLEAGRLWTSRDAMPAELLAAAALPIGPEAEWLWRYEVVLADDPPVPATIVRGKVIGGSGAVNGGYFVRATVADFEAWSRALGGSDAWSFDAVLPFYCRIERDLDFGAQPWHGDRGPIPVVRGSAPAPVSAAFEQACRAAGFAEIPDLNAPGSGEGVGAVPCNCDEGRRIGPSIGYLLPALARPNLSVAGGTLVTRVRFDGTRAVGVEYVRDGESGVEWADRIVLCAGAIESATLLLRSGIGDPEQSRSLGIPVVHAAPVGAWLSDHPEVGISYLLNVAQPPTVPLETVLEVDDVEIRPYAVSFTPGVHRLGVTLMRPRSSGVLRLRSADPAAAPLIDYRYLSAEADRARLRDAVATAGGLLRRMNARPVDPIPRPADLDGWLRANLATSQHLSGTCRMGRENDAAAVVDERCRVHGVTGLSVVDLSVVPVPLGRGPQATTMMIAEKAAAHLSA